MPELMTVSDTNDVNVSNVGEENFNRNNIRHIITKSENPNPLVIIGIVIALIVVMYCIYIVGIKKTIGGKWIDEHGKPVDITHSPWTDIVTITIGGQTAKGKINGIILSVLHGNGRETMTALVINDTINWKNGSSWKKASSI
jgi:hypothetical protein